MKAIRGAWQALRQLVLESFSFAERLGRREERSAVLVFHELRIGDLVLFSGALRLLRRAFPRHRLLLAARDDVTPLAEACLWLDEIVPIPPEEILGLGRLRLSTLRRVAQVPVRMVVNNNLRRGRGGDCFVRLIPARNKVGLEGGFTRASRWERALRDMAYTKLVPSPGDSRFEMEHTIDLLEGLGIAVPEGKTPWRRMPPELWITEADRRWAEEALSSLPEDGLRVVLFPSARFPLKLWPVERYAAVAKTVADQETSFVLNLGGPPDRLLDERLKAELVANGLRVCDIGGASTLRQLVAILNACDMYLGSDTAAVHMATALGLGTVCPTSGGCPGRFYPWGDPELHRAALHRTDCYGCNWRCSRPVPECIMGISVEDVVKAFVEVREAVKTRGKRPQGRLYVREEGWVRTPEWDRP